MCLSAHPLYDATHPKEEWAHNLLAGHRTPLHDAVTISPTSISLLQACKDTLNRHKYLHLIEDKHFLYKNALSLHRQNFNICSTKKEFIYGQKSIKMKRTSLLLSMFLLSCLFSACSNNTGRTAHRSDLLQRLVYFSIRHRQAWREIRQVWWSYWCHLPWRCRIPNSLKRWHFREWFFTFESKISYSQLWIFPQLGKTFFLTGKIFFPNWV